jgi:hypothetical protein
MDWIDRTLKPLLAAGVLAGLLAAGEARACRVPISEPLIGFAEPPPSPPAGAAVVRIRVERAIPPPWHKTYTPADGACDHCDMVVRVVSIDGQTWQGQRIRVSEAHRFKPCGENCVGLLVSTCGPYPPQVGQQAYVVGDIRHEPGKGKVLAY